MLCPVCRHDNFEGEDTCVNCAADMRTVDIPQPATEYQGTILGEHLDALGAGSPVTVEPGTPVAQAIGRMHADGIDCLLVSEGDRLVGIFTDRDAVVKAAARGLGNLHVSDIMTPDPVVLRREDTLAVAIHKMAVGGFRHIPIVDGNRTIGVVAARDVFRHIAGTFR